MACGAGCTDCPTCRGEVLSDSPVMKDIDFAMAMARGPMYEDKLLGPLNVAQMVRDSARMRYDGDSADDRAIHGFLDALIHSAGTRPGERGVLFSPEPPRPRPPPPPARQPQKPPEDSSVPPPAEPVPHFDPRTPGPGGARGEEPPETARAGGKFPRIPPGGAQPRIPGPSKAGAAPPAPAPRPGAGTGGAGGGAGGGPAAGRPGGSVPSPTLPSPTGGSGKPRCCVRSFDMPKPLVTAMPRSRSVGVSFGLSAAFISLQESGGECDCKCCEIRQWVIRSEYTSKPIGHHGNTSEPPYGPREDCMCGWLEGVPVMGEPKLENVRIARCDPAEPPRGTDWILCAGEKGVEQPKGYTVPGPRYVYSENGCSVLGTDDPHRPSIPPSEVDWKQSMVGFVWDVCYKVERSVRDVKWNLKGTYDTTTNPPKHPKLV